jgi:hypothetical protein
MMEYGEIGPCNFLFLHYFLMTDCITLVAQFTNPDLGDKDEYGIGLSYPARQAAGQCTTIVCHRKDTGTVFEYSDPLIF